jgi:hypothetical protein
MGSMIRYDRDGFHHAEIFAVPGSDEKIFARCDCPRQDDHDYAKPEQLESADDEAPGSPAEATRQSPTGRSAGGDE